MVDSPFNEDSKNVFFQGGPNFGGGRSENLGKMGNNRDIYCYADRGVINFEREYQFLPPSTKIFVMPQLFPTSWYQNPCDASTFLHARPNFRGKGKKTQFSGQNLTFL